MFVLAHANHPEMFIAGVVVGVVLALAHVVWRRVRK
jgi:hypothetical protein